MKKILSMLLCLSLLLTGAWAEESETIILLSDDAITVNGANIGEDPASDIYLAHRTETHEDVPEELASVSNRVITITEAGVYRFSGTATDAQIAVKAGSDDNVRIILDGIDITCRTAPGIAVFSAHDPREAGKYGVTIELADGSENTITGSHTTDTNEGDVEFDGAIGAIVSLGFEGNGSLTVDADNEGIEVASGHMTINGGKFHIEACDDPLNVSEDGFGVLTVNDGYLFSSVKAIAGGEGDGIDSNGSIVFNGGTVINLAHPTSQDSGIDSDMGSSINGGIIVGAGNMYDPIEASSEQLFMMLEFGQETDDLVVVTDADDKPVFAYDFPHDYMYIAFSTPELQEGTYRVYLGGEIEGEQQDGLYDPASIVSYTPGTRMQHGGDSVRQRGMTPGEGMNAFDPGSMGTPPEGMQPGEAPEMPENWQPGEAPEIPENWQPGEAPEMPENWQPGEAPEMPENWQPGEAPEIPEGGWKPDGKMSESGMRGPRGLESSADVATTDFVLSRGNTGFTNVTAAE